VRNFARILLFNKKEVENMYDDVIIYKENCQVIPIDEAINDLKIPYILCSGLRTILAKEEFDKIETVLMYDSGGILVISKNGEMGYYINGKKRRFKPIEKGLSWTLK
jgi:hypothetical protein